MTRIVWLIPLFVIVAACGPGEEEYKPWEDETIIEFPDPEMEGCIKTRGFVPQGEPVRMKYVYNLTKIECISSGITDLTGLEKMPWVKELDLSGNPITSLEPLNRLILLEKVEIGGGVFFAVPTRRKKRN